VSLSAGAVRLVCHDYGDAGLLVDVLAGDADERWAATRDLGQAFRDGEVAGVVDVVASFVNVFVQFDPLVTDHAALREAVDVLAGRPAAAYEPRTLEVPVVYGGQAGPDLDHVADALGLTPREVVELHSSTPWTVRFVGSPLGAPLMDGPAIPASVPRLANPRVRMEPGSVGMSGTQSIIYNAASPGGWQIVGRTREQLFDVSTPPHVPYRAGDRLRFVPTDAP
jgi:KipI family sensor histidine kinase inhibitor